MGRYEEVIIKMRDFVERYKYYTTSEGGNMYKDLIKIFPELKENRDEKIRKVIYGWIYTQPSQFFDNGFSKEEMIAWLEKQREQKPAEWSEEDEIMLTDLSVIVHTYFSEISGIPFKYDLSEDKIRTWLKSLKQKYTWRPSDEQMKALHDLNLTGNISYAGQGQTLIELQEQLKKLKGE